MPSNFDEPAVSPPTRRAFLVRGILFSSSLLALSESWTGTSLPYSLAPQSLLPPDVLRAPAHVIEAYRFAVANRETLRYIPCYCGCGSEGHASNAACYVKDGSKPGNLLFDRMSLG